MPFSQRFSPFRSGLRVLGGRGTGMPRAARSVPARPGPSASLPSTSHQLKACLDTTHKCLSDNELTWHPAAVTRWHVIRPAAVRCNSSEAVRQVDAPESRPRQSDLTDQRNRTNNQFKPVPIRARAFVVPPQLFRLRLSRAILSVGSERRPQAADDSIHTVIRAQRYQ